MTRYAWTHARDGSRTLRDDTLGETFHPELGMEEEIRQLLDQPEVTRVLQTDGAPRILWDLGLGAGGMAAGLIRHLEDLDCPFALHSFDVRWDAFDLALEASLPHLDGLPARAFRTHGRVAWRTNQGGRTWDMHLVDLTRLFGGNGTTPLRIPPPDLTVVDLHSPETQPELWTLHFWSGIARHAQSRPGLFLFHTRATLVRASLLLAGFYVGRGRALGKKEETTLAATRPGLLTRPLGHEWLGTLSRSTRANPLILPDDRRQPIEMRYLEELRLHPQFQT